MPTNAEYTTLYTSIGGTDNAGIYLKSTDKWYSNASTQGIDLYGFSVLPAGYRDDDGSFSFVGRNAYLWSASGYNSYYAYYQDFDYAGADVSQFINPKSDGFSLRCLQD